MDYQGKTKEQIQYSNVFAGIAAVLMIIMLLISWIFKL